MPGHASASPVCQAVGRARRGGVPGARHRRLAVAPHTARGWYRCVARARAHRAPDRARAPHRHRAHADRRARRPARARGRAGLALRERPRPRPVRLPHARPAGRSGPLSAVAAHVRPLVRAGGVRHRPRADGAAALPPGAGRDAADRRRPDGDDRPGAPQLDRRRREPALRLRPVRGRRGAVALAPVPRRTPLAALPDRRVPRDPRHRQPLRPGLRRGHGRARPGCTRGVAARAGGEGSTGGRGTRPRGGDGRRYALLAWSLESLGGLTSQPAIALALVMGTALAFGVPIRRSTDATT